MFGGAVSCFSCFLELSTINLPTVSSTVTPGARILPTEAILLVSRRLLVRSIASCKPRVRLARPKRSCVPNFSTVHIYYTRHTFSPPMDRFALEYVSSARSMMPSSDITHLNRLVSIGPPRQISRLTSPKNMINISQEGVSAMFIGVCTMTGCRGRFDYEV